MGKDEKQRIRQAVREYFHLENRIDQLNAKVKDAQENLRNQLVTIEQTLPPGETTVIRLGSKTLVLSRNGQGIGNVQITQAAVA